MSKLVRDKIPEIIEKNDGIVPSFFIVEWAELDMALDAKLDEEISELRSALDAASRAEEIADIIEVLLAIGTRNGFSQQQIEEIRMCKCKKRGWFEQGIILE